MRSVTTKILTAGLVLLAASPVFAQRQPGGPGFGPPGGGQGPSAAQLVANDKVVAELKISDEQKAEAQKAAEKVREKFRDDLDKARNGGDREKATELRKTMGEETDKAVFAALKPEQAKRLQQIVVQAAGPNAFNKDDVIAALKLTDKDKAAVKEELDGLRQDIRDLMQDAAGDADKRAAAQKKIQTLRTEAVDKIVSGLTDEQKKAWKELAGDKFEGAMTLGGAGGFPGAGGPGGFPGGVAPGGPGGFLPGGGMTINASFLLRQDKVVEELKITDDQKSDVQKATDKVREKYRDDMQTARSSMDFQKMQELGKAQNEEIEKAVGGILKADQSKRLTQIEVQTAGLNAFDREDVQSALKLSDAQKKDVEQAKGDVQKEMQDMMREAFQGGFDRDKMTEAMKKVQTLRTDAVDKIVKGLSDDQKKAWKDLTGEKFEATFTFGPPGGPRPGRPNPNP